MERFTLSNDFNDKFSNKKTNQVPTVTFEGVNKILIFENEQYKCKRLRTSSSKLCYKKGKGHQYPGP